MSKLNLTGQRFSRLLALRDSGKRERGEVMWLCECDCGKLVEVLGSSLKRGNTKSCGCLRRDVLQGRKNRGKDNPYYKHGFYVNGKTRLIGIYYGMRTRCYNRGNKDYKYYGERGVTICDKWLNSLASFRDFALSNGYEDNLTIHRKDNDKGYYPENCEFITRSEHSRKSNEERR